MRILIDENIPLCIAAALREAHHDVVCITDESKGISDEEVLEQATSMGAVVLTMDKDFGELARKGVVLLRLAPMRPNAMAAAVVAALAQSDRWLECFSVIEPGRVRMIG